MLNDCATDENHVFMAENGEELIQAFRNIAGDIMAVYVSK
jgi:hypothetical protein